MENNFNRVNFTLATWKGISNKKKRVKSTSRVWASGVLEGKSKEGVKTCFSSRAARKMPGNARKKGEAWRGLRRQGRGASLCKEEE